MVYPIDSMGTVTLGTQRVAVPKTVSAEAQAFLATPPYAPQSAPKEPVAMWDGRAFVDEIMKQLSASAAEQFPVEIEEQRISDVRCHVVRPRSGSAALSGKVLINLHGGGFVLGSGALVEAIPIANLAKIPVIAVDYRLAPEHPYPAAVEDVLAVYKATLEHHHPKDIGIFGSSAGGFLTGQITMRLQKEGLPLPACLGILTAGGDLHDLGESAQIFTLMGFWGEPILPPDHKLSEIRAYVGSANPKDPSISPIYGDLSHFPPTLLVTGTRDALLSGASRFHRALRRAGVSADLFVYEAMPHAHWYMLGLPEAREAIDFMVSFFIKHLGRT